MDFGNSGFGFDVVNGIHRVDNAPMGSGPGGKMTNRDRIQHHSVDRRNTHIFFAGVGFAAVCAILFHQFVLTAVIVVLLLWWASWSGNDKTREEHCEQDPVTGDWYPVDDVAKMMIGYGDMFAPFVERENRLIDILVSAKTLPPEMDDSTVRIECEEYDDAKTVFNIYIGTVNGVVAFFQKNLSDIAGAFGDPDRHDFHKVGEDENGWSIWQLTVYEMPKNISAGVAWE